YSARSRIGLPAGGSEYRPAAAGSGSRRSLRPGDRHQHVRVLRRFRTKPGAGKREGHVEAKRIPSIERQTCFASFRFDHGLVYRPAQSGRFGELVPQAIAAELAELLKSTFRGA